MEKTESLHSEDNFYEMKLKFDTETWKRIYAYTHIKTEEDIHRYMYNHIAKEMMKGNASFEYAQWFKAAMDMRKGMKDLAANQKPDLTEGK